MKICKFTINDFSNFKENYPNYSGTYIEQGIIFAYKIIAKQLKNKKISIKDVVFTNDNIKKINDILYFVKSFLCKEHPFVLNDEAPERLLDIFDIELLIYLNDKKPKLDEKKFKTTTEYNENLVNYQLKQEKGSLGVVFDFISRVSSVGRDKFNKEFNFTHSQCWAAIILYVFSQLNDKNFSYVNKFLEKKLPQLRRNISDNYEIWYSIFEEEYLKGHFDEEESKDYLSFEEAIMKKFEVNRDVARNFIKKARSKKIIENP